MSLYIRRITKQLFHQACRMHIHTICHTIHRVTVLQMLCFIQRILVLYIIGICLTGLRGDVQLGVQPLQFHTTGCHGKKGSCFIGRACIHMHTVSEHLRIMPVHPVYQLPVLPRPFRRQFAITCFGFLSQSSHHLQCPLSVCGQHPGLIRCKEKRQRLSVFLFLRQITRPMTGKHRYIKRSITRGSWGKLPIGCLIGIVFSSRQCRILINLFTCRLPLHAQRENQKRQYPSYFSHKPF